MSSGKQAKKTKKTRKHGRSFRKGRLAYARHRANRPDILRHAMNVARGGGSLETWRELALKKEERHRPKEAPDLTLRTIRVHAAYRKAKEWREKLTA